MSLGLETIDRSSALLQLVEKDNNFDELFTAPTTFNNEQMDSINQALARRREQKLHEKANAAAEEITTLVEASEAAIEGVRRAYNQKRREMESLRRNMEDKAIARIYGQETMNWLPLKLLVHGRTNMKEEELKHAMIPMKDQERILKAIKAKRKEAK